MVSLGAELWFNFQPLLGHDRNSSVVSIPDDHAVDSIVNE